MGKLKDFFKHPKFVLLYPNSFDNQHFINYLRSRGATIGKNTRFISPEKCVVDPGRTDYISIGDNCCLSNVSIICHDYSFYTFVQTFNDLVPDPGGRVTIGNNCFIGFEALILKGTTIGDNVIIGARSVVKGNIPSNTVWAGNPAHMICSTQELYQKRVNMRIESAIYRRNHIREKKKRDPSVEEMGLFAFLFLERTEENYKKYISRIEYNGIPNSKEYRALFFGSKPTIESFNAFLSLSI